LPTSSILKSPRPATGAITAVAAGAAVLCAPPDGAGPGAGLAAGTASNRPSLASAASTAAPAAASEAPARRRLLRMWPPLPAPSFSSSVFMGCSQMKKSDVIRRWRRPGDGR
jgi:hypothetical protein